MPPLASIWEVRFAPTLLAFVAAVIVLGLAHLIYLRVKSKSFLAQAIMFGLTLATVVIVALVFASELGAEDTMLQVIGGIIVGTLGLASTTILGNALAGVQIRLVRAFKPGDFIRAGDHFGQVTVQGLFHTEIQTEDSDLTTLPNLFLASKPYRVVQDKIGTIISATVSLGYDEDRDRVEGLLLKAASQVEVTIDKGTKNERLVKLEEPLFVHIVELGDFSVTYRVCGKAPCVQALETFRSTLRKQVMDTFQPEEIEIVSPTFMRSGVYDSKVLPPRRTGSRRQRDVPAAEDSIYDKGSKAKRLEDIKERLGQLATELTDAQTGLQTTDDNDARSVIERSVEALRNEQQALTDEQQALERRASGEE